MAPAPAAAAAAGLDGRVRVREGDRYNRRKLYEQRSNRERERVARNRFVQFKAGERNEKKNQTNQCVKVQLVRSYTHTNTRVI